MTTKNAKTILFASLIVAMILPFSGMNFAAAEEKSTYVKMAKQQKSVQNMTEEEKAKYEKSIKDTMTKSSYDRKVYNLLEKLSKIQEQVQKAEEIGKDTTKLTERAWSIVYDLEDYGVVSEERLLENKDYWHEKRQTAKDQINNGETVGATFSESSDAKIYQVHTANVSLKNVSEVDYICFPWPLFLYCGTTDTEWGGGSDSHASQTMIYDGTVYMEGKIVAHNTGGHDRVYFTVDTEHDVYNAFGTHVYDEENGPQQHWLEQGWNVKYTESYDGTHAVAGSTAHAETHLDTTVTVTG